jgi:hypothetical protein
VSAATDLAVGRNRAVSRLVPVRCATQRHVAACGTPGQHGHCGSSPRVVLRGNRDCQPSQLACCSPRGLFGLRQRAGTTPNGVFASKLTWDAVDRAGHLRAFAPEQRFVWLRRDPEAIGVSWAWAAQTGRYHAWDPPPRAEPHFVREDVDALVRLAREQDLAWGRWFSRPTVEPLELWFDDVVADPRTASASVLAHLGYPTRPRSSALTRPHRRNGGRATGDDPRLGQCSGCSARLFHSDDHRIWPD